MHNIGFYASSNAVFGVHDCNKMFRDILYIFDWLAHGSKHK